MQGLFLEHNRLIGTIPKLIYQGYVQGARPLPLVQIFLEQNLLSGMLNRDLATLPNLLELYVVMNKFTGVVPPKVSIPGRAVRILTWRPGLVAAGRPPVGCTGVSFFCPSSSPRTTAVRGASQLCISAKLDRSPRL